MNITKHATDEVILSEVGRRLGRIRLEKNLTQAQLAKQAGISKSTLVRLESGGAATRLSGLMRVCRVLDLVERLELFLPEPAPSPVAQLKLQGRQRRRATGSRASKAASGKTKAAWRWGDER